MAGEMETRLAALFALIDGAVAATCLRNRALPSEIPAAGLVIQFDGQPGEPEISFSPLTYDYDHRVTLEILVQASEGREAAADTIRTAIGAAIAADRSLGGICHWVEAEPVRNDDHHIEGGKTVRQDELAIVLSYSTANPLT